MTKEEFLAMVSSEIDKLEEEEKKLKNEVEYYKATNPWGAEILDAEYRYGLVKSKIEAIKRFIELPAYERIQAMSVSEIEKYKKGKIHDLQLEIDIIDAQIKQEEGRLSGLVSEREQLIDGFSGMDPLSRKAAANRGREISSELNARGGLPELERKKAKITQEKEQLASMTPEEIKKQLSSEIKGSSDLARSVESLMDNVDLTERLKAVVAEDPKKAREMASLLVDYEKLDAAQRKEVWKPDSVSTELPSALQKKIETEYEGYPLGYRAGDLDSLITVIADYQKLFLRSEADFMKEYTEEKLLGLVGKDFEIDNSNVDKLDADSFTDDIEFLRLHNDKLQDGILDELQALIGQRRGMKIGFFNKKSMMAAIKNKNIEILKKLSSSYEQIIAWYKTHDYSGVLGVQFEPSFRKAELLKTQLAYCKSDIRDRKMAIDKALKKVQDKKVEMEGNWQNYEARKESVAQQIRAFGGKGYEAAQIGISSASIDRNMSQIQQAGSSVYQLGLIERVQQEAQMQADIEEAQIRGITLEELWEERGKKQAADDESMGEFAGGGSSHGM